MDSIICSIHITNATIKIKYRKKIFICKKIINSLFQVRHLYIKKYEMKSSEDTNLCV